MDGQYNGYGFSNEYFFSNAFREYGNTADAWPDKSLSFWRFQPSGSQYAIGDSQKVWTVDNLDQGSNTASTIYYGGKSTTSTTPTGSNSVNLVATAAATVLLTATMF